MVQTALVAREKKTAMIQSGGVAGVDIHVKATNTTLLLSFGEDLLTGRLYKQKTASGHSIILLFVSVSLLLGLSWGTPPAAAVEIQVKFDRVGNAFPGGVPEDDPNLTQGRVSDASFEKPLKFGSLGASKGSIIKNNSTKTLRDLHLKLTNGDKFSDSSTGGAAFPMKPMLSADKTELTLSGGNIPPGRSFWAMIPKAPQPGDGTPIYEGLATDKVPEEKDTKKEEKKPNTGNDGTGPGSDPQMNFDSGSDTLQFLPGEINFAEYVDGTIATTNGPMESIIGSQMEIATMHLLGPSPDLPGAFRFSESGILIQQANNIFLSATLTNVLLIPDQSMGGFDSVLQATLAWEESQMGLGSRFVKEYYGTPLLGEDATLFFHSNLLGATDHLFRDGMSIGTLDVSMSTPIPEPSSFLLFGTGLVVLVAYDWRRRKEAAQQLGTQA